MSVIYSLDNEYGGRIIGDGGESTTDGLFNIRTASNYVPALKIQRTVVGVETVAPVVFGNLSGASVPVIDFGNNFISVASIGTGVVGYLGCAQKWIVVRAGGANLGIPLFGLATAVNGAGAY